MKVSFQNFTPFEGILHLFVVMKRSLLINFLPKNIPRDLWPLCNQGWNIYWQWKKKTRRTNHWSDHDHFLDIWLSQNVTSHLASINQFVLLCFTQCYWLESSMGAKLKAILWEMNGTWSLVFDILTLSCLFGNKIQFFFLKYILFRDVWRLWTCVEWSRNDNMGSLFISTVRCSQSRP